MRQWQAELAAKVAAMEEEDWEESVTVLPDARQTGVIVESARVEVRVGLDFNTAMTLAGRVNGKPIGRLAAGTVRMERVWTEPGFARATFGVRRHIAWNHFLRPDGTWGPLVDAVGEPPYPRADFDLIPDPG